MWRATCGSSPESNQPSKRASVWALPPKANTIKCEYRCVYVCICVLFVWEREHIPNTYMRTHLRRCSVAIRSQLTVICAFYSALQRSLHIHKHTHTHRDTQCVGTCSRWLGWFRAFVWFIVPYQRGLCEMNGIKD